MFIVSVGNKIAWVYLFIVLISVYEVLMRYLFNSPTTWVHETSLALAGIAMVYGGLYAYAKDKHISVSVIVDLLPRNIRLFFKFVADILGLIYIVLLGISTFMITKLALFAPDGRIQLERSGSSWNSVFPGVAKLFMSIFILLFIILIFLHIVVDLIKLIQKK